VPMRPGAWKEESTAPVSVWDRRGTRVGMVSRGQMPESGQTTLTTPLTTLLQDIVNHVVSQGLRLGFLSAEGYHPSDSYHRVLKQRTDPQRPWHILAWRRIMDSDHACLDIKQRAETLFGPATKGWAWAQQMRQPLHTPSDGLTRGRQSAAALRLKNGR